MYIVYKKDNMNDIASIMVVDKVFNGSFFCQAHYYVCMQTGMNNRRQDTLTLGEAREELFADGNVVYPDYTIELVKALTKEVDYADLYKRHQLRVSEY